MPFGDRTGPLGQGPRTGRGAGYCSGFAVPGSMNRGSGFGSFGRGGGGRGRRNWFQATGLTGWQRAEGVSGVPPAPQAAGLAGSDQAQELAGLLKSLAERFERALESIDKRLEGLAGKAKLEQP
jgi:hypothetical protein